MAAPPKKPTIRWFGRQTKAAVRKKAYDGLRRATAFAQAEIKRAISKPAMVGKGGAKSPSAKSKRKPRRYQHSKPGEPPRAITGKLRQSIFQSTDRGRMLGSVGTTLKYGAGLEKGTTAHEIVAVRKKVLVFGLGDQWIFTKRVDHPGVKKRSYLWATIQKHKRKIRQILLGRIGALFRGGRVTFGGKL